MLATTFFVMASLAGADPVGVLPKAVDGRSLNFDFETGDLRDWKVEGDAFKNQPVEGDTVAKRRPDMKSNHQGKYWIGGWEKLRDRPVGTLTSVPFKVTHPWASFLIGGGAHAATRLELIRTDNNSVIFQASGLDEEDMRRVAVDLSKHQGQEIVIKLKDGHTGGWGHLNFDDFRFHDAKPEVPARPKPKGGPMDEYPYAGLPPDKAAEVMTVPEGFDVKLFAGEPDVKQPIGFCLDDRGRLWVAEAYTYPKRAPEGQGKDRIVILEDTDGDGKHDKRTVFMEGLNLVSGIEYGFGGLWVGAAPYFMFIPIDPSGDKPAGPPKILLDGWGYEDTHETLNTFTWGPDGWLYGCHGVFTHSKVGKPGTPDKDRIKINAGVFRYHPTKHIFEVFAHGTSNPWGLDFNEFGDMFVEACVIPHCFHIIQGARYHRQAGSHFNPHTYDDIKTIADHLHFATSSPHAGNNKSDAAGGGHAHCGLLCYQGGAWPKEYHGQLLMGNIHGRRLNMDTLKQKGSGYVASHGPDFLKANDAWARFINMRHAPDGNVYLLDWYDQQACHHNDPNIWDRSNGRIYKICYRGTKPVAGIDLAKKTDEELVDLVFDTNVWFARHASRLLQERQTNRPRDQFGKHGGIPISLQNRLVSDPNPIHRLRAMWVQHVCEALGSDRDRMLVAPHAPVRAWAVQLNLENGEARPELLTRLVEMARSDPDPMVRRFIAAGLQRIKPSDRFAVLEGLLSHAADASDHNLPYMYWFAAEPLATVDPARALALALNGKIPMVAGFMVRRVSSIGTPEALDVVLQALKDTNDNDRRLMIVTSLQAGLKGRRNVPLPKSWSEASTALATAASDELQSRMKSLAVTFGDPKALGELRGVLANRAAGAQRRIEALDTLLNARDPELVAVLQNLLDEPELRSRAIKALAQYADAKTPGLLIDRYSKLGPAEKRDILGVLVSRTPYAAKLLDAIAEKKIPSTDVPAEVVRQLRGLNDAQLTARITEVWGQLRDTPAERRELIRQMREVSLPSTPIPDLTHGRAIFAKTCQQCHTLYGVGANVGPDITGANRRDIDYLLENILDSSAVIPKEYTATRLTLSSGRVLLGLVKQETPTSLTFVTAEETLTIPVADIEMRQPSDVSMMPDDLLKNLSAQEIRALIAYLRHDQQVPMLADKDNVKDFFNGKDLTGWDGDPKLWSVENGEIVGRSPGLKKNEFLKSHITASDFRFSATVKLTPNAENSGIQFRSEPWSNGEMKGPQADIGRGWWGKLYEESGRGLLWSKPGDEHVKSDDWNDYVIEANGSKIRTWINGHLCVDLDDPQLAKKGIFGLQIHSGGPMEVRFKNLKLELLPRPENAGAGK
jgi:putative membrane-bound dehydrogenase-like protein